MRPVRWLIWGALVLGGSIGTGASATDTPVSGLSAIDLFNMASKSAEASKTTEALTLYDTLALNRDIEIRAEARFRKGQLLARLGRYREAAVTYRRLLDEKPRAARVRLELAQVLAKLGNEASAFRELRQAQAIGLPPDIAAQIAQLSRSVRSPQRAGGAIDVALAPDSNINRATQLRTLDTVIAPLDLSSDARQTSGTGIKLFGQAFAKHGLGDRLDFVVRGSALASLYQDTRFNDVSASLLTGLEWRFPRDRVTAAVSGTLRWYGSELYADNRSLSLEWLHSLGMKAQLSVSASAGQVMFSVNPLQNGKIYDTSVSIEHSIGARSGVAFGMGLTRQTAVDGSYAYTAWGPTAYGWRDIGRATLFIATTTRRLIGDDRNFLFLDKRREWLTTFRAGSTFRQISIAGLSPVVRFGYERNNASIALYDYSRKFAEIGLTRSF